VVDRDPVAEEHVAVAIEVNRITQFGVESLDRLLGDAGSA
jgi:hypothetical protein